MSILLKKMVTATAIMDVSSPRMRQYQGVDIEFQVVISRGQSSIIRVQGLNENSDIKRENHQGKNYSRRGMSNRGIRIQGKGIEAKEKGN